MNSGCKSMTLERGYVFRYSETLQIYKIFILETRRIIARCDVKFMEDKECRRSRYFLADE